MELNIIEKKEKLLLLRTEIIAEILFEGKIPSKGEIKKEIGKEIKTNEDLIIIKKIRTYFGLRKVKVAAYVYSSKGDIERMEPKKKEKKKEKVKKEEKEEKAKEQTENKEEEVKKKEAKEEKPKEEKKAESEKEKTEEKKEVKEEKKEEPKEAA